MRPAAWIALLILLPTAARADQVRSAPAVNSGGASRERVLSFSPALSGSAAMHRLVVGGAPVVAATSDAADGQASRIELRGEAGERVGVFAWLPARAGAVGAPVRIESANGGAIVPRAQAAAVVSAPSGRATHAPATLTWRQKDGATATLGAVAGVPIELVIAPAPAPEAAPAVAAPPSPPASTEDAAFALAPIGPNPIRNITPVRFQLPKAGTVKLQLFDLAGRHVADLASGAYAAGSHAVLFEPRAVPAGRYYLRLTLMDDAGFVSRLAARPVVLLR